MPLYRYESFSKKGERIAGTVEAASSESVKELLRARGLLPVKISSMGTSEGFTFMRLFETKVDSKALILFTKQLAVLLRSGVPLLASIELLSNQFEGQFRRILVSIKDGLKGGDSFATTLERYPKIFPNIYVQLIRAGEASGKLDTILDRLTTYLAASEETRKKISGAMTYPIMILSFAGILIVGMLTFVVPNIVSTFAETGAELPTPTKILIGISDFTRNHFLILGSVIGVVVLLSLYIRSTTFGRLWIDRITLRLPYISYFSKTKAVVQFSKTLGLLLESGVNLSDALDIVCNIIDNTALTRSVKNARDKIIKEGKIAHYLKETNIFPPIANYMIQTGEESGKLSEMLLYVGSEYDEELSDIIDGLIAKINPIMMLGVGGIIFFIVISMFLPMIKQGEALGL